MKKSIYLIVLVLILGLALTGCTLLSNISQVPATGQSEVSSLTKDDLYLNYEEECPAAPAVAGLLLEAAGVDNRYGTGKDGGNFIKDVANHMWPETDFDGVNKCDIIAYECAVCAFLNDPENDGDNYPAGVTSQYAGVLDAEASGAEFKDNENRTGTMTLTVLDNCCGKGIEGLVLADIEVDIPDPVGLSNLFTLGAGGYWDIVLTDKGNGVYEIVFFRLGSVPYTRYWDVIVKGEVIEEDLYVAVTNIFEAELESVVYEGTCNTFGTNAGETMTFTFSNDVVLDPDLIPWPTPIVYFDVVSAIGTGPLLWTAEGNQVVITTTGTFNTPRPDVGDRVTGLAGIVDTIGFNVIVPAGGVEIEGIVTYDLLGDWMMDLYTSAATFVDRFVVIDTFEDGVITGFFGIGYDSTGAPTGEITGTVDGQLISMHYERTDIITDYTADF